MVLNVYSVYDKRAKTYALPMCFVNDDLAIRAFSCSVVDGSMLQMCHEDYVLRNLGTFDDSNGVLYNIDPLTVISASEIVDMRKDNKDVAK